MRGRLFFKTLNLLCTYLNAFIVILTVRYQNEMLRIKDGCQNDGFMFKSL
ncbi:MAG: hypothetical protein BSOLF_0933 [Candidatus Carbobacillus altaicus]|uniref:Uncharacterized protein n=1 Tax=Candidatus Carbonibacillus altaicus TaxID=2163959 RepID=A0A2R6Y4Z8_9BACL|nr:MAG: hypothetical protein BSOLF_0933 [Candidatus Carbobacillus altaicus]